MTKANRMAKKSTQNNKPTTAWDRVLRFSEEPSPAAAQSLLKLEFSAADRQRMKELAAKARAGTLTSVEEAEADTFERLGCVLDILHSNARKLLNSPQNYLRTIMQTIRIIGEVDDQHRLVASVPPSIPPGSIEVLLVARADGDDDVGQHWMDLIAREWHDELSDTSQDIYTLEDGVPIDGPG